MKDVNLLRAYKLQNPRKYALKFGDKSPEEIELGTPMFTNVGNVSVEMGEKKAVEVEFQPPQLLTKDDVVPESLPDMTLNEDGTQFVPRKFVEDKIGGTVAEVVKKRGRPKK